MPQRGVRIMYTHFGQGMLARPAGTYYAAPRADRCTSLAGQIAGLPSFAAAVRSNHSTTFCFIGIDEELVDIVADFSTSISGCHADRR
jgi:hypothetical protein